MCKVPAVDNNINTVYSKTQLAFTSSSLAVGRDGKEVSLFSPMEAKAFIPAALNCWYSETENPVTSMCPPFNWASLFAPPPVCVKRNLEFLNPFWRKSAE